MKDTKRKVTHPDKQVQQKNAEREIDKIALLVS